MAKNVAPDNVNIDVGLQHLLAFNWIYGFVLSIATYWPLNYFLADCRTPNPEVLHGTLAVIDRVDTDSEKQIDHPGDVKSSFEVQATENVSP